MTIKFGISASTFATEYQEKKPFLMKGAASTKHFSWKDVNEIYQRSDAASNNLKLSLDGIRAKNEYVESYWDVGTLRHRLIRPVVYDYLRKGATLIANKITNEPQIYRFSRAISEYTCRRVVSSAYAAFGTKDSYRCHWDTRDVFAVQLIGRKRWILYEPSLALPLYTQQSRDYEHMYPCPDEIYMDTILEPGDVLYVPRGWWHNPLPVGDGTFHLAIGTFPAYAIDYLSWALNQMPNLLSARKALSCWEQDQETLSSLTTELSSLLTDQRAYAKFMDEFIGATRVETPLAIDIFGDESVDMLKDETQLRLATPFPRHGLHNSYVLANGTKVNISSLSAPLVTTIAEHPGIDVRELCMRHSRLGRENISKLVTDLCRQDILEIIHS
ncbi:JmjC domain-containing protein [Burkholderia cepacia]|uniref:JmjC domain-containing protein n=1 Tax=Burkholderia cepacia TaxID=292 RepID=UPI00398EFB0C